MPSTRRGSFLLCRLGGIDVFLHWSWFLVAAFEISGRGRRYPSIVWNVVEYLMLFLVVTLHEFGHAFACRQVGGTADKIVLWPLGGVTYVDPPPRPAATLWSIAAGPLVNLVFLAVSYGLTIWAWHNGWRLTEPHAYQLLRAFGVINLGLLCFNLLPIYPLDGGQILRSLLWFVLGKARSLKVVAVLGLFGAVGLIAAAFFLHSFWIVLISLYIAMNCWRGLLYAQILSGSTSSPSASRDALREEYTEITDPRIQSRVRARHSSKIASLQSLGFQMLAYPLEALPSYSAILKFPLVLAMFKREVLVFPKPARLALATAIFVHSNPASIALCFGLGVRLYTLFSDSTLLISHSYRSAFVPGANSRIIQSSSCQSLEEAWLVHKSRTAELEAHGLGIRKLGSFTDYIELAQRLTAGRQLAA